MEKSIQPITITIDGQEVRVSPDLTILQAAQQNGIRIPTLCHHPALSSRGGCRLCVVEVNGAPRLVASCVSPVRAGMSVVTSNARIIETRRTIVEFLFAERNHNCMFCPRSGDCELQDLAYELQMNHLTVPPSFDAFPVDMTSEQIGLDHNRCVLCGRCVRACEEISGCYVLNFQHRGPDTMIGFDLSELRASSSCTSCGACLQVCPTGALYNRFRAHYAVQGHHKEWQAVQTVCPLCGLLCPTVAKVRDNDLIKIEGTIPAGDTRPEGGQLCRLGRFEVLKNSRPRLLHPMVKTVDGAWVDASWESALDMTVEGLNTVRAAHGGEAVAGLVSGLCSNEELVSFRDLMVKSWQAGQVATLENSGFQKIYSLRTDKGQFFQEASWKKIADADFILTVGAAPQDSQPALGALLRKRMVGDKVRSAAIGPIDALSPYESGRYIPVKKGDELSLIQAVLGGAMHAVKKTAALADAGRNRRPAEPLKPQDISTHLRLDERSEDALDGIIRDFVAATDPIIIVGEDVASRNDFSGLDALVDLALLKTHYAGDNRLPLIVLKPCGNSMGAWRLLPRSDQEQQTRQFPKGVLLLLEQEPPRQASALKIPDGLEFLAVISPYRSPELEDCARVLLPKPVWMETDGTCTSLDGCEIAFRPKMLTAPDGIKPAWQTLGDLAARARIRLDYGSWDELRRTVEREFLKEVRSEQT